MPNSKSWGELASTAKVKTVNRLILTLLRYYWRLEVEGVEHLPERGGALIAPNHSGYMGTDALILMHIIKRKTRRMPRVLAHRAFFDFSERLKGAAEALGLKKASIENGIHTLKQDHLLILFPEGEQGNFKSSILRYHVQPFHTGFIRMALKSGRPIVPCAIIGAEDSHLNLGNINLSRFVKGLRIPIPLNLIPLPARWKIVFLKPFDLSEFGPEAADDKKIMGEIAWQIRFRIQKALLKEVRSRPYIYTEKGRDLLNRAIRAGERFKAAD